MSPLDRLLLDGRFDTIVMAVHITGMLACVAVFSVIAGATIKDPHDQFRYIAEKSLMSMIWPVTLFIWTFKHLGQWIGGRKRKPKGKR